MIKEEMQSLAKSNILRAVFEIKGESKPLYLMQWRPMCFCTFEENELILTRCSSLFIKKVGKPFKEIEYHNINSIEVSICNRMDQILLIPRNSYYLDLIIKISNEEKYKLEVVELDLLPKVLGIARMNNISIIDKIGLESILEEVSKDNIYKYLEENYNTLAQKYNLDNPRISDKKCR